MFEVGLWMLTSAALSNPWIRRCLADAAIPSAPWKASWAARDTGVVFMATQQRALAWGSASVRRTCCGLLVGGFGPRQRSPIMVMEAAEGLQGRVGVSDLSQHNTT